MNKKDCILPFWFYSGVILVLRKLPLLMRLPVYLIRRKALGDVLWIEPVIRQLSKKHRKVIVYTKFNPLFENYPAHNVIFKNKLNVVEKLLGWLKVFKFILLDKAYEARPQMHFLHAYQLEAGVPQKDEYPRLYLNDAERKEFSHEKPYVVLHINTPSEKNYRKVYGINWEDVVAFLRSKNLQVISPGSQINPIPGVKYCNTSIRQLIALIYNASLFIGIDSGPSHIAASLNIPSILFFGSVNPAYRHFEKQHNAVIMQKPCVYAGCYHTPTKELHGNTCKLVGNEGMPPCTFHTTKELIDNLNKLILKSGRGAIHNA